MKTPALTGEAYEVPHPHLELLAPNSHPGKEHQLSPRMWPLISHPHPSREPYCVQGMDTISRKGTAHSENWVEEVQEE